eukprot:3761685-Pleurochrysis_carterae.AAC.2
MSEAPDNTDSVSPKPSWDASQVNIRPWFTALPEGAQRVARSRDVAFALSFLEQREWRVEDWIAALILSRRRGGLRTSGNRKRCG